MSEAMRSGRMNWAHDVRRAVETLLERVAWDDMRAVRPALHQRDIENRQLDASWRITAPMRTLKQLLAAKR